MGGDYRKDGMRPPPPKKNLLGDANADVPPTIATFSKQKVDFFQF